MLHFKSQQFQHPYIEAFITEKHHTDVLACNWSPADECCVKVLNIAKIS